MTMTDQSQPDEFATRRCVLLGAGVLGATGLLTACSTAAVPYDADVNGNAPATAAPPTTATASGSGSAAGGSADGGAKTTGTLLGMTADVPVGGGKVFTAAKVVVTQPVKGQFKAFSAVCTHVGCLCNQVADGTVNCPCHGSKFKITDGSVTAGPAPTPLAPAAITVAGGKIMLS
jgi:nitrite reductase/ring-hydroxylating ferredoxin subunit